MDEAKPEERIAFNDMLAEGEKGWQKGMEIARRNAKGKEKAPTTEPSEPVVITDEMRRGAKKQDFRHRKMLGEDY